MEKMAVERKAPFYSVLGMTKKKKDQGLSLNNFLLVLWTIIPLRYFTKLYD